MAKLKTRTNQPVTTGQEVLNKFSLDKDGTLGIDGKLEVGSDLFVDGKLGINDLGQLGWWETKEVEEEEESERDISHFNEITSGTIFKLYKSNDIGTGYTSDGSVQIGNYEIIEENGELVQDPSYSQGFSSPSSIGVVRISGYLDGIAIAPTNNTRPLSSVSSGYYKLKATNNYNKPYNISEEAEERLCQAIKIVYHKMITIKVFHPFFEDTEVTLEQGQEVESTEYLYNLVKNFRVGSTITEKTSGYDFLYLVKDPMYNNVTYDFAVVTSFSLPGSSDLAAWAGLFVRKNEQTGKYYYLFAEE